MFTGISYFNSFNLILLFFVVFIYLFRGCIYQKDKWIFKRCLMNKSCLVLLYYWKVWGDGEQSPSSVCGAVVITTAQTHSSKSEIRFCAGSNPVRGVSDIRDGEDLWQWSRLEIRLRLSSVNHHHHQST